MLQVKAGKGKKTSKLHLDKDVRKYSKESKGAHNMNYYVNARMKDTDPEDRIYKAIIIDCRLRKGVDPKASPNSQSYDYYLHFCSMDRRMDRWIPPERVFPTGDYIEPEDKKKKKDGHHDGDEDDDHEGMDPHERQAHEDATKIKTIHWIKFGKFMAETWYYSPYPDDFQDLECIYYCEFCLQFFASDPELKRHISKCTLVHPPGNQIYHDEENKMTVWEVDANRHPAYCENLGYLSKLFLDHKLLLYPIDPFLFFVLCEYDEYGHHIVGYFSKNKYFAKNYNLSCILALPFHQRKGYGKFLITLSYEISKKESKIGTPERPLSDLGRQAYMAWWTQTIIEYIREQNALGQRFTLSAMSRSTGIMMEDIIETLEKHKLMKKIANDQIALCTDPKILDDLYKQCGRPTIKVDPEKLKWVPYVDPARDLKDQK